jgi:hypothetical protein
MKGFGGDRRTQSMLSIPLSKIIRVGSCERWFQARFDVDRTTLRRADFAAKL